MWLERGRFSHAAGVALTIAQGTMTGIARPPTPSDSG